MPKAPKYGVIYNWDGAPHGYSEYPQSTEAFLQKAYAPMRDTQVGAHFWSLGSHVARWKSDVLEMVGESTGRRYRGAGALTSTENMLAMLERGEDPQEAIIRGGHELGLHVYASIRMNDNHFGGAQVEDLPTMSRARVTRMRREHPEWLLGDQTSEWFALSLEHGGAGGKGAPVCPRRRGVPPVRLGTASSWTGSGTASTCPTSTATGCATR